MIKILHGENIVESRKRLTEILEDARKNGIETVIFNGGRISLSELRSALESGSFFGKTKLIIVENLLTFPKSNEKKKILDYLSTGKFDNDLIIWESKEIKGEPLSKSQDEVFKLPSLIFHFLDSLKPGNSKESLQILGELRKTQQPEIIFSMMVRQFRFLLLASDLDTSGLSELSSWQQKKFLNQAKYFNQEQLREIYRKLLEIDYSQKTSGDPFSLSFHLDLLVASL